jgi:YgiT-type zinc finger domain-containing protein
MRCVVCRHGETRPGAATLVLERDGLTLLLKHVPAEVCETCGEEYVDEAVAARAGERRAGGGRRRELGGSRVQGCLTDPDADARVASG